MKFKNIFNLVIMVIITVSLLNCSTIPMHQYPADVNVQAEIDKMDEQLKMAQQDQLNVFAPRSFVGGIRSLEDSRKALEKNRDRKTILTYLGRARAYTDMVYKRGERAKKALQDVADARANAIAAGAMYISKDELELMDADLTDFTERLYSRSEMDIRPKDIARLQSSFLDLELRTIKRDKLGVAYNFIKSATAAGARNVAPDTLVKAQEKLYTAEKAIESDRHSESSYGPVVRSAIEKARDLFKITLTANNAKKMTPEQIALEINAQEKIIEKSTVRSRALLEKTSFQKSYIEEITEANHDLAGDLSFQTKLREIETRFPKTEAEVYRQGRNVVIRLKSIQFATSRADLPPASLATLSKVNDVIRDLDAQRITIEGHTDSIGGKEKNVALSQRRADSVGKYFISRNTLDPEQVKSVGRGYSSPLTTDKTKEGRAQNRRVDIIIEPKKI
jgi:OmpA-OmpF porin, OOP family